MAQGIEEQFVESLSSPDHKLCVKNFIWSENEWPGLINDNENGVDDNNHDIPVISLQGILGLHGEKCPKYDSICQEMVDASGNWGFFKLVDHGVGLETIEKFKVVLNDFFFGLPMEEKMKGARSTNLPLGYSATNPDYGSNLPWVEILQLLQSPQQVADFATKVFGDQHHRPFSNALIEYMKALDKLGMMILEMLAHGLGLPRDFFSRNFDEKTETMLRVNRYPPCPLPEKCLGLGSHSDPHTLTILLQDDQVGGLQVLTNHNRWIQIRHVPNSFVINIGDTLEAWSNGRLKSVVHRAVVNRERSRVSAAYFLSPTSSVTIECPPQLLGSNDSVLTTTRKYVPFTWADFKKQLLSQKRVVGKTALNTFLASQS